MRRASSSFLLRLAKSNAFAANAFSQAFAVPRSQLSSSSNSRRHLLLRFLFSPSRALQTLPSPSSPLPPNRPTVDSHFSDAIASAATADAVIAAFDAHEPSLAMRGDGLGAACLKTAERVSEISSSPGDLERALALALRALKCFDQREGGWSLPVAGALRLMGSISCKLRRYDDSLESLCAADEILQSLLQEGRGGVVDREVVRVLIDVQIQLASTKNAMGRRRDALMNTRKSLQLKESILEPNCREMGEAFKDAAEAYAAVLDFDEAMAFCSEALEIYGEEFGHESPEVAEVRRLLALIYTGMDENEEAMEQNELCRRILARLGLENELIQVEIDAANIQIALGRLEEATNILKRVIHKTEKESEVRALVLVTMAKTLCSEEKFGDSRRCLEIACGILDKKESVSPAKVAEAYADISMIYETMNDFEISLSLMKRTLAILQELPQEQHLEGSISARMGWLLLFTNKVSQAFPYLEIAVEKLKGCFGPKHFGLGFVYKHLGQAYLDTGKPESAVQMLELAKDVIVDAFGQEHEDSIDIYQSLANAYGTFGSYSLATKFQLRVIDAWEKHGPHAADDLREAHRLLEQLKKKAQGQRHAVFPANSLPAFLEK